ncbi:NAD-dependent epimerase/dehydratase family protein [Leeuwenhoekiella parthenopeia]|uniref:GDP-mannose 4,6-dehydratase n=1 Tax=Leeuwenhoekiella parthenopeia TaxID=2890320 RepID=A0ABS8GW12_9FLAO|nr:NAD-dependent epimerase/dehydratase family protein [Leeuwenhoekiella parthenopeia]MCC4214206.1 GDP-mannose 4,6-dehydratase [Leeuwenhoekiella parthenopeia]
MKALVTGAAGFIGSHCAERLREMDFDVVGIDNFSPYYSPDLKDRNAKYLEEAGIPVKIVDLREPKDFRILDTDFDYIFHFAAQPGIASSSSFEDYLLNNLVATKNLIDFALTCKNLKLFTNISTSSIYGLHATLTEDEAPEPASFYGVTKLAAEQLVLSKTREKKMKTCSLRLFSVYGPRERPEKLYTKLIGCGFFHQEFPLFEGSEDHVRSFTFVEDIIDGVVSVIGKEETINGEVVNLGTEQEHTTGEGIAIVEKLLDTKIRKTSVPKRGGDQMFTKANIDKARRLLNYNPSTTLEEGLKQQIEWYRKEFVM